MRLMKKHWYIAAFVVALMALALGLRLWRHATPRSNPAPPAAARSLDEAHTRLETIAANSGLLTLETLDTVHYDNTAYPIPRLAYCPEGDTRYRILLVAGVHGNEPAGPEALMRFVADLAKGDAAYPGVVFDIVPILNPWGWVHRKRRNGAQQDLNRDFNSFKARESVLIRDLYARNTYDAIIDFHEDGHTTGFYYYRLANPDFALCRHIIDRVREAGHPIEDGRVMKIFRARDGVITSGMNSLRLARLIRQFSMTNYFRIEGSPNVFLFETPSKQPFETRVAMHRAALDGLLEKVAEQE
jgi:murein peptide amidase A